MTAGHQHPLDASVHAFLDYLKFEKDYSANTLAAYRRDLDRFAAMTPEPAERISRTHIDAFVARLHSQGLAPRSIQRALSSVRSFFRFLVREGSLLTVSPSLWEDQLREGCRGRLPAVPWHAPLRQWHADAAHRA